MAESTTHIHAHSRPQEESKDQSQRHEDHLADQIKDHPHDSC